MTTAPPIFEAGFRKPLEALLHWRRDVRHFQRRAVPEAEVQDLLRIACLAPSVGNSQPWRFARIRAEAMRMQLADHADEQSRLAAQRYPMPSQRDHYLSLKLHGIREAPELIAVLSDEQPAAGHGLGIATMPEMLRYSTVMAIHTLWLAAQSRGIGLGWVSIIDPCHVAAMLDVPASWVLIALLCIGYPEGPSQVPELEQRAWQPREALAGRVLER